MTPQLATGSDAQTAVWVDTDRADGVARDLSRAIAESEMSPASWDDPDFWNVEGTRAERCQYLAVGNAINFRFWDLTAAGVVPSVGRLGEDRLRGSMFMWRRLRLSTRRGVFSTDARALASLTPDTFRKAFTDDEGRCPLEPGLEDRVANLRDLGERLGMSWNSRFVNVVDAAAGSLKTFEALSAGFRAFDDPVQKLTMVNAIMLTGSGLVEFDEEPRPGIDYHLVKQAVRQGLVKPSSPLAAKLMQNELLDADEALALRHSTLAALMEIADRADVPTTLVDNAYWLNRRVCDDTRPACQTDGVSCPFEASCEQRVEFGLPLELTRYY